jgi:hypothetical protein
MSPQPPSAAQRKRVLNLIWFSMIVAVAAYGAVHSFLLQQASATQPPELLPKLFIGVSAFLYVAGWVWHYRTLRLVQQDASPTRFQRLGLPERAVLQNRLQASVIVTLALFETPLALGLVNTALHSPMERLFEWLAGVSLLFFVMYRLQSYPAIFHTLDRLESGAPGSPLA